MLKYRERKLGQFRSDLFDIYLVHDVLCFRFEAPAAFRLGHIRGQKMIIRYTSCTHKGTYAWDFLYHVLMFRNFADTAGVCWYEMKNPSILCRDEID